MKSITLFVSFIVATLIVTLSTSTLVLVSYGKDNGVVVQWEKTYGPYLAYDLRQTMDGGFIIAGQNASYQPSVPHSPGNWLNYTALLIKTDKDGNVIWEKSFETVDGVGFESNRANSIVQTNDLGYALCGNNWMLKLDAQGNVQWNRTFNAFQPYSVIQTSDKNYAVIGNTQPANNNESANTVLIKIGQNGEMLWNKTFSTNLPFGIDVFADALRETDNGFAIAGGWNGHFWFAKTDKSGNLVINQTYSLSTAPSAVFTSMLETSGDGFVLAGTDVDLRKDVAWTAWVIKINSQGVIQWSFHFDQPVSDLLSGAEFRSIVQTSDGEYIVGGYPAIVKIDSSGRMLWNVTTYNVNSILLTDGGIFVAGGKGNPNTSDQRIWLSKFASESEVTPSPSIPEFPTPVVVLLACLLLTVICVNRKNGKGGNNTPPFTFI